MARPRLEAPNERQSAATKAELLELLKLKALVAELKFCLVLRRFSRKYRPDQPRDDRGRWVYDGGRRRRQTDGQGTLADAGNVSDSVVMTDANPDPVIPGAQYAQTEIAIHPSALTGISTIDDATKSLTKTLARVMDVVEFTADMSPQTYGTAVHGVFALAVRAEGLPGIAWSDVETTFGGDRYGAQDSIRTDVVLRNEIGDIIAIYDVKTGNRGLEPWRVIELRNKTGVDANVPIIELHVVRGVSRKALDGARVSCAFAISSVWQRGGGMAMEMNILSDRRLASIEEWQRAVDAEKYPLRLQTRIELATVRGFVPAQLDGKITGFECYNDDPENTMKFLGEGNFDHRWRFALGLRWLGSKIEETQAAWMAAVAYVATTGGVIFDHEEGKLFTPDQAREVVRRIASDAVALDVILEKVKQMFPTRR